MPKDIRDILKEAQSNSRELKKSHRERFEERLTKIHKPKNKNYFFLKIAASIVVLIGIGYFTFFNNAESNGQQIEEPKITNLSSVSPEMKQIENYYLTAINYEMASIEFSNENKAILDTYLEKIAMLSNQYTQLTAELAETGINEKIINALIDNLQFRLQILLELKDSINEMKTPTTIENENSTI